MFTLKNEFLIKNKKKIIILLLIILSPIILSIKNVIVDFIYNCGKIIGTNFRYINQIMCNNI